MPAKEKTTQSRGSVLVVDDNERLARTVATFLEMEGFTTQAAFSAEQALTAIGEGVFDVAVLDINMPGMDGIEMCRRVVSAMPDVRVLMLTGREGDDDEAKAHAAGARRLLIKPLSLADLRDEIVALLPA